MINGIQVSSVKPLLQNEEQVREAFAQFAKAGCTVVQLQWIDFSVSPEFIADCLRENGLVSVSTQDFYVNVMDHLDYFLKLNALTGGHWFCVSRIPAEYLSRKGLAEFAGKLAELQTLVQKQGMELCFHPTRNDYADEEGLCPFEYLMETLPGLSLCLDLHHAHLCGRDFDALIHRYEGRICMVHFKDYLAAPDGSIKLVPAGQGQTDWAPAVRAALDTKVPYAFVEQETWDRDPFVCLKEALDWLNAACGL